jgi:tryptophan-rich sensory protein
MKQLPKFIISVAIPLAVGAVSGFMTKESISGWYATLIKPSFNPPNYLFAPVWTALYILMGIAFFLVWRAHDQHYYHSKRQAIIFYIIQLALNFSWSILFFYFQQPLWALADIILLWVMIFVTIMAFAKVSSWGAWLLVPYICWVSFATLLNFNIWELN